jgi:transcriptional regulator with XRE-family HTH domain
LENRVISISAVPTKRRRVPPDAEIARRIRRALEYHGVSQAELARRVDVTRAAVSQILSSEVTPSDETLIAIGEALGEDWEWLGNRNLSGKTGLGALIGNLYDRLGDDRIRYLESLSTEELRGLIDLHRNRREPAAPKGKRARSA